MIVLNHKTRQKAVILVASSPDGYVVTVKEPKRSTQQNALLWSLLKLVSDNVIWHGQKLTPEEWKHVFTAGLKKQKVVPGIDGGFVVIGQSTSAMGVKDLNELIELVFYFCEERRVKIPASQEFEMLEGRQ
jgi:hypothetical protein